MDLVRGESSPLIVKVVLVGDSSVGKTSLVNAVHEEVFSPDHRPTVGACFITHIITHNNTDVKLHIWDTAGQERYRALTPMYYRDAHFVLLVYAIDNEESFERIHSWRADIETECLTMPCIVLVANKIDLVSERTVSSEDGEAAAEQMGAIFYEVSAKEQPEGITAIFDEIAKRVLQGGPDGITQFTDPDYADDPADGCKC